MRSCLSLFSTGLVVIGAAIVIIGFSRREVGLSAVDDKVQLLIRNYSKYSQKKTTWTPKRHPV